MKTPHELEKQIAQLQSELSVSKKAAKQGVIASIKTQIQEYEITASELGFKGGKASKTSKTGQRVSKMAGKKVAAKYRGPQGQEWSGRGVAPSWIAGKDRASFLI